MGVAADDHLGFCSDGALENPVVRRVSLDHVDALVGRAELVPEDAKGLRDDGVGDCEVDLTIGGEVEEVSRFASELQRADKNVGVSDDALHERVRDSRTAC